MLTPDDFKADVECKLHKLGSCCEPRQDMHGCKTCEALIFTAPGKRAVCKVHGDGQLTKGSEE